MIPLATAALSLTALAVFLLYGLLRGCRELVKELVTYNGAGNRQEGDQDA